MLQVCPRVSRCPVRTSTARSTIKPARRIKHISGAGGCTDHGSQLRIIREALPCDMDVMADISALCSSLGGSGWSREQLQEELTNPISRTLVLEVDGRVRGFVVAWLVVDELQVLEVAIHPASQNQGLGLQLMQHLLSHLRCATSTLEVKCSNVAALRLYSKLGYEKVGIRRRYYPDGTDAVLMTRITQ